MNDSAELQSSRSDSDGAELPALPRGWCWTTIGEITENHDGRRVPVKATDRDKRPGAYPYYGASGIIDDIDDYLFDGDYLLIAEDGANLLSRSTPIAFRASGKFWVNNHAHVVRSRAGVSLPFLEGYLNGTNIQFYVTGTAQPKLNQVNLNRIPCPLAPLEEQRRVVAKVEELLSDLDAGVTVLERVKANLKRYRAAILQAAVTGKLTEAWRARHPDAEPASELLQRILTERRSKWEEGQLAKYAKGGKEPPQGWQAKYTEPSRADTAGLPELPKDWCWAWLGQLLARGEYGTSVKCNYGAEGPPVLRIPNIVKGEIDLSDLKYATVAIEVSEEDGLQQGDLLVCRTNGSISLVGKAALVNSAYRPPHAFASYLLRFRFVESKAIPKWVYTFFTSHQGRRFIESHAASSAGQHNISLALLQTMPIPLPPLPEQEELTAEVERRLSIIEEVEAKVETNLRRAALLRQSILKLAFEGRLVPQDPTDEPADKLLERIRQERTARNGGTETPKQPRGRRGSRRQAGAGQEQAP
jgi:type I restriction enzyme S subunit